MPDLESGAATGTPAGRDSEAPPLTLLGSVRELNHGELTELYSYPRDHRGAWVRANVIASVDGGATTEGVSGGLGGPGDRLLFNLLRELADVIVVGAGTVRIEGYAGAQPSAAARRHRQSRGQNEVPRLAIVTNSGRLDADLPVFTRTAVPPLVLTRATATEETRRRLAGLADVVDCSGDDPGRVDVVTMLTTLESRGLCHVLTEGGPALLGSLVEHSLLDELCLTISPCVVGGRASRILTAPDQLQTWMRCAHVAADASGYLYTRYVKE